MYKILKNEFALSKMAKIMWIHGFVLFLGLTIFIYASLYTSIRTVVREQSVKSITNISQLNESSVSKAIVNRKTLLELLADRLSKRNATEPEEILGELEDFVSYYDFYSMGYMDKSLTIHLTNGDVVDMSAKQRYQEAWDYNFHISSSYLTEDGESFAVNMFSYPVYIGGELKYVLIAHHLSSKLTERMNINSMGGKGYNFILNSMGDVVIYPQHYDNESYNALMKHINETPEIIPNESGDTGFTYDGEKYYAHFERMDINGWHLMTCAKESDVFADANKIIRRVFMGMAVLWLMVIVAVISILVSRYRSKQELTQAVFYDDLLNIGNGEYLPVFYEKLSNEEKSAMAMFIFDIDKFKEFNYIYGEICGDNLLKYIVAVFNKVLPEDYLFRYMADQFVALIHCKNKQQFVEKADALLERFYSDIDNDVIQPFDISGGVRRLHGRDTYRRAFSDALIAKGTIKGIHLQQYAFYDESILQRKMSYMEMESDFIRALKANEFKVYYQPKYDMRTGEIIGSEALVRWVKEDGTIVSPAAFIPCFEASRQIILLDEVMLENVCIQMNKMKSAGLNVKRVSVNLSRVHLRHPGILDKIESIIKATGVDTSKLSFEITESALYEDSIPLTRIIDFLHQLGCKVEMDDYGVGVSGPNSLANNSFDVVKLDKSFIDGIGDERIEAVIKSTVSLSRTLGMEILAEGVEEKYQAECLVKWGCNMAQGYYYSKPVTEDAYKRLLGREKSA